MNKKMKKAVSLILALVIAISCLFTSTAFAAPAAKCDTTGKFAMDKNATYQFCITASSRPCFSVGDSKVLRFVKYSNSGNKYFYKVQAVGKADDCTGIYVNGVRECIVSIKSATSATDVATNDPVANAKWLAANLGFYKGVEGGAYYNPNNKLTSLSLINVGYDHYLTVISFRAWDGDSNTPGSYTIKSKAQQLFKFYLPNDYMKLYNMIEAWNNGSDAYTGKHFTLDNRDVIFYWYEDAGKLQLQIGDKNVSAKTIYYN
jgi:hypothetical protein